MMDDEYRKQLEAFGIEQSQVIPGDMEKRLRKDREESAQAVLTMLMNDIKGRQWLYDFLDVCMTHGSVFVPGKQDLTTFFLGAQWVGQILLRQIMRTAPQEYHTMIQEEAARRTVINSEY